MTTYSLSWKISKTRCACSLASRWNPALNAGCPLDLDRLPAGGDTRTVLDKAEIVLMRFDREHFRLETARSFAEFVWNVLESAGREFEAGHG